jgi:GNAT superfamily N-acetyltransferase
MPRSEIAYRPLAVSDLSRLGEIDRTERIDRIYVQHGTRIEQVVGDRSAPPWELDGDGEHSVAALRAMLEQVLARGAIAVGAFADGRLVGFGVVLPHVRAGVAQLVALYVSSTYRGQGVGGRLTADLEEIALDAGDTEMVVSATPSANTVHFYLGTGFEPTGDPLPELYELEPEDIHMRKSLEG